MFERRPKSPSPSQILNPMDFSNAFILLAQAAYLIYKLYSSKRLKLKLVLLMEKALFVSNDSDAPTACSTYAAPRNGTRLFLFILTQYGISAMQISWRILI